MTLIKRADANPTKSFFVRMITRDISLEDCILDLIDNSIDGAWALSGGNPMTLSDGADLSPYRISIIAAEDRFEIVDNCGGISLDDASEYAFTFGRKDASHADGYSIGVYGIGMKRAVFKIGNDVEIVSTYTEDDATVQSFRVPISVNEWLSREDRNWDFDLETSDPLPEPGVKIGISVLNAGTADAFSSPAFIQGLRRIVSRDYALHLARGLTIIINGEPVVGWKIKLLQGAAFAPMRREYDEELSEGSVHVEVIAGMAALPSDEAEPDAEVIREDRDGWYVICNGRIVVAADKSMLTGWGTDGWPKWHPQYSGFLGIVIFSSESAALLPLTTTKRSVDASSAVYRQARPLMRDVTKKWITYTNDRKLALDEAKTEESKAVPVAIREVVKRDTVTLPQLTPKTAIPMGNIAYSVPRERIRALAQAYGDINLTYREVGTRSFEEAYSEWVGDE